KAELWEPSRQIFLMRSVRCDQLLALAAVHDKDGCAGEIQSGKLFGVRVQPLHGTAIVVLVLADDKLFRHALDPPWIAAEWLHCISHGRVLSVISRKPMPAAATETQRARSPPSPRRAAGCSLSSGTRRQGCR